MNARSWQIDSIAVGIAIFLSEWIVHAVISIQKKGGKAMQINVWYLPHFEFIF